METLLKRETETPATCDDFTVGDRIYAMNKYMKVEFGNVTAIIEPHIHFRLDSGETQLAHVSWFKTGGSVGKCFPIEDLEVGSVVSILWGGGRRLYADVTEYVYDEYVEIRYQINGSKSVMKASEGKPLDFMLAFYTLEG